MDTKRIIELYTELSLIDKRNELSSLIQKIDELLTTSLNNKNIKIDSKSKNFNIKENNNMDENEMLAFIYEDLLEIKNKLLLMMVNEQIKK